MAKKRSASKITAQGVELIDLVIDRVRADPTSIAGFCGDRPLQAPEPLDAATLDQLAFPSGRPLPPSLQRWLADMPFLGVMYPGFDVFMGDGAGVCSLDFPTYEGLFDDSRASQRTRAPSAGRQAKHRDVRRGEALTPASPPRGRAARRDS